MSNNGIDKIVSRPYNGILHSQTLYLLEQEYKQLKIVLFNLINEIKKINELIQNLTDYYKENHIIYLPVSIN